MITTDTATPIQLLTMQISNYTAYDPLWKVAICHTNGRSKRGHQHHFYFARLVDDWNPHTQKWNKRKQLVFKFRAWDEVDALKKMAEDRRVEAIYAELYHQQLSLLIGIG